MTTPVGVVDAGIKWIDEIKHTPMYDKPIAIRKFRQKTGAGLYESSWAVDMLILGRSDLSAGQVSNKVQRLVFEYLGTKGLGG